MLLIHMRSIGCFQNQFLACMNIVRRSRVLDKAFADVGVTIERDRPQQLIVPVSFSVFTSIVNHEHSYCRCDKGPLECTCYEIALMQLGHSGVYHDSEAGYDDVCVFTSADDVVQEIERLETYFNSADNIKGQIERIETAALKLKEKEEFDPIKSYDSNDDPI